MRSSLRCLLTAVLLGSIAAPLFGQEPPRLAALKTYLEAGVDAPFLLANPGVKKEINLTDSQSNQVRKIVGEVLTKYQPKLREAADREQLVKVGVESIKETRQRVRKALPDILKPEQLKRLDQIQLQANGILAFKKSEVRDQLKLSVRQSLEIAKIGADLKKEVDELLKDASVAPVRRMPAALRQAQERKESATRKAIEKLTEEQQKTWKEMNGEKFDFKLQLPLRRGVRP
jgi:hypothetical protein